MRITTIFAGVLIVELVCAPAFAQSLADRETARSLMDDGDAKRGKGDKQGALKSYEAADALMHVPTTGLEVAKAQAQLELLLEARETLARLQRLPAKPNEPAAFVAARKSAEQLTIDLAARLPSLLVNVTSGLQPVTVTIDGETIPPAALAAPRKMNPGVHAVVARAGGVEKREDVTLGERDARTISLELRAPAASPPPPPPPAPASGLPRALEYGGFGLAIVGVGVGTVTGVLSLSKVNDVKPDCTDNHCPPSRQSDIDAAKSLGTVSTIAFIAAGAGAAVGVVGLVLARRDAEKSQAHLEPLLGLGFVGARGTF